MGSNYLRRLNLLQVARSKSSGRFDFDIFSSNKEHISFAGITQRTEDDDKYDENNN